jgi:hypothetical protein
MQPFSHQPSIPPCPACGGRRVAGKETFYLCLENLRLSSDGTPLARTPVIVCTNCGQIAVYAESLDKLHEQIQKHPERFRW